MAESLEREQNRHKEIVNILNDEKRRANATSTDPNRAGREPTSDNRTFAEVIDNSPISSDCVLKIKFAAIGRPKHDQEPNHK